MSEDLLAQAEEEFVAGRFDAVADLCGELIAADPKSHQAYYLLGRTCLALGRSEEALEMIGRAVEIAPSAAPYHTELGNLLATTGDFERAAGAYFEAIRLAPDFIDPHVNLGAVLQLLGRREECAAVYEKAIQLAPDAAMLHYNLAMVHQAADDMNLAVAGYKRAAELEPDWPELHRSLGNALLLAGNAAEAIACIRKAISLAASEPDMHVELARALMVSGDTKGALATCDAYMASHPYQGALVAARALILNEMGSEAQSRRLFGLETFLQTKEIKPPAAFGSIDAFDAALAEEAAPFLSDVSLSQALQLDELQDTDMFFFRPGPAAALLMERIEQAVQAYIEGLPDDPNHPLVANTPRRWRLSGRVERFNALADRTPHIRPTGWLSGIYIAGAPTGCLSYGTPPSEWQCQSACASREVSPKAGEMVLFPSYLYHRTIPADDESELIYCAFDVVAQE